MRTIVTTKEALSIGVMTALLSLGCSPSHAANRLEGVDDSAPFGCTRDAKTCPDGTNVGRVPPNCEWAACPGEVASGDAADPVP
jgi:hypothetical protein